MRIVTSNSMAKSEYTDVSSFKIKHIPVRSMIFVKLMPSDPVEADEWYRGLKVGDVLTFRYVYATQVTITHRIVSISEKPEGGFVIELAGDNKSSENGHLYQIIDTSIPENTNYVIGKVTGRSFLLGVILSFLSTPVGLVLVIIIPCLAIIVLEIAKIVRTMEAEKRKHGQLEDDEKDRELSELRRRIAELEQAGAASSADQKNDGEDDTK